jgi:hypothetical protein
MDDNKADVVRAFVEGASLHASAAAHWAALYEEQPDLLSEFIGEQIVECCGAEYAWHGFAGRRWADHDPLGVTLEDTLREAARRVGWRPTASQIAAACARQGVQPGYQLCEVAEVAPEVAAELATEAQQQATEH